MNFETPRRATKIVATLGPALADPSVLEEAIARGLVDVFRLNFSHDTFDFHQNNIKNVREAADRHGRNVAILADLQGPKIRIKGFKQGRIMLEPGMPFCLDMQKQDLGDETCVGVDYPAIIDDCKPGDTLLLDDGKVALKIERIEGSLIHTTVLYGGKLSDKKGINLQGGGLSAPAITEKDREVIKFVASLKVDFIAVSFVKSGDDMRLVRKIVSQYEGFEPQLVAKIERGDLFNLDAPEKDTAKLDDIISESEGIMVARGDLAVEVGPAKMVGLQKLITKRAIEGNSFVIMATQMMESMITESQPTRAEITDVGNAILEGADAIMFSAETAMGKHPIRVLETTEQICQGVETLSNQIRHYDVPDRSKHTNQAIAYLAVFASMDVANVRALISFSKDAHTVRYITRHYTKLPVYCVCSTKAIARRVAVLRGVYPVLLPDADDFKSYRQKYATEHAKQWLEQGRFDEGDKLVFTFSLFYAPVPHWTNTVSILRVEDMAKGYIQMD